MSAPLGDRVGANAASPPGTALAHSDYYLFDILEKPAYLKSWNNLFRKEKNVDQWLMDYANTKYGVTSPEGAVKIGGKVYQKGRICAPHFCGMNFFCVLFAPNGAQAWGLQVSRNNERFFGKPDDEIKNALRSVAQ